MDEFESLNHTKWECLYHVVFIPKCRRKMLYVELRKYLGEIFRRLAEQKESRIEEGHLMPDHVHMLLRVPPKYAVSQVVGYIKGTRRGEIRSVARPWGAAPLLRRRCVLAAYTMSRVQLGQHLCMAKHLGSLQRPAMTHVEALSTSVDEPLELAGDSLRVVLERWADRTAVESDAANQDAGGNEVADQRIL